jgi:hypothetical protein
MDIIIKNKKELERIKKNIQDWYQYFRPNFDRYNEFMAFVFESSLSKSDIAVLQATGKPQLEFNILEAYISKQRGEFSTQEPSFEVGMSDDTQNVDPRLIQIVDGYLRHLLFEANKDGMEYDVFTDLLGGGFSALKIFTKYAHPRSRNQNICIERVYDPTLIVFDKLARTSTKHDGRYSGELYPKLKEDFESEYGTEYTKNMKFGKKNLEGFNWAYANDKEGDILLMCDYYEKVKKKAKMVQLVTGQTMTVDEYEKYREDWEKDPHVMMQVPAVIGKPWETEITSIKCYLLVEDAIIDKPIDTDFGHLPHIFVDGNSVMLRRGQSAAVRQLTRPYVYHAKGVQRLKNYAGNTLANELENMVQHKWVVAKEAIPEEYKDAYINPQKTNILVFNQYAEDDPTRLLSAPQAAPRVPSPPEVTNTFTLSDEITQAILGSYQSSIGRLNQTQLSGEAITQSGMESNTVAKTYLTGFMKALNQAAVCILDLMPKYILFPRNLPMKLPNGKKGFAQVNTPDSPQMDFDPNSFNIKIEAGVNFEIQKQNALQTLIALMKVSPVFAQFMGEEGLETLLDNIDIRGIDGIKQQVSQFVQKMNEQKQMAQKMQMQTNPMVIKQKELEIKSQQNQVENQLDAARIQNDQESIATDRMLAMAKVNEISDNSTLEANKIQAEQARTTVELAAQVAGVQHTHKMDEHHKAMDLLTLHHDNEHKNKDRETLHSRNTAGSDQEWTKNM